VEVDAGGDQDDNEDNAGETSKLNDQLGGLPINMSLGAMLVKPPSSISSLEISPSR